MYSYILYCTVQYNTVTYGALWDLAPFLLKVPTYIVPDRATLSVMISQASTDELKVSSTR